MRQRAVSRGSRDERAAHDGTGSRDDAAIQTESGWSDRLAQKPKDGTKTRRRASWRRAERNPAENLGRRAML
jgi:hypothetical protein